MSLFRRRGKTARDWRATDDWAARPRDQSFHLDGLQQRAIDTGHARLVAAGWLFLVIFTILGVRMLDVSVRTDAENGPVASHPHAAAPMDVVMERADIIDRNGTLLASSLPITSLYANGTEIQDPREATDKLLKVLPDLNAGETYVRLASKKQFVYLRRNLTPTQQYQVNGLGIPGLYFQKGERRIYPQGNLVSHIIGMTDLDNKGVAGLERSLDDDLQRRHDPLALSIDLRIQAIVHEEVLAAQQKFNAVGAMAVVMDVHTSEILSMVSLPDFDPNAPGSSPPETLFNRATLGVYEMGSTFKLFNTSAGIDSGTTSIHGGYDAAHAIKIGKYEITDYHNEGRWLTVPEILLHSSNIGSARMAMDMGPEVQRNYLGRFGMMKPLHFELSEIGAPLVPSPWREINAMTIAYGHGMAVTPLHVATGASAIVNGGIYRAPTLLKRPDGEEVPGERIIKPETSRDMRLMMRLVVTQGTASKAEVPGYNVGGKTGTAEKVGAGGGYRHKALLSSFIAAFPINDPKYVVLVMVDEPQGNKESFGFATAGWTAAPAVGKIIERIAPILGVMPQPIYDPPLPDSKQVQMVHAGGKIDPATE